MLLNFQNCLQYEKDNHNLKNVTAAHCQISRNKPTKTMLTAVVVRTNQESFPTFCKGRNRPNHP